jgi:hypothetical protein
MNPVTVSIEVPSRREDVYEFLDVLANHEQFTNHMLVDWSTSGRLSGVGARARMRFKKPGRAEGPASWRDDPRDDGRAGEATVA